MLFDNLQKILRDFSCKPNYSDLMALHVREFNNEPALYRSRNRRPRTDLMVKGLNQNLYESDYGLIAKAALKEFDLLISDPSINFEHYIDITISSGEWYEGKKFCKLAVEVENSWDELKGTMKDLLLFQAKMKWGVFYNENIYKAEHELLEAINIVWKSFEEHFQENTETQYELLILPESLPATGFCGIEILEAKFQSKDMKNKVKVNKKRL